MTGFGDLIVQRDVEIRDVSQVSAWDVVPFLEQGWEWQKTGIRLGTLTHVLTRHPHGDGGAGLGVASVEI